MKIKLITALAILSCSISCNKSNSQPAGNQIAKNNEGEDFDSFLKKFVADSTFRQTRVNFPLRGYNSEDELSSESKTDTIFMYNQFDWQWFSEEDLDMVQSDVLRATKLIKTDSSMIYHRYRPNSGYDMRYDFQQKEGKWYLIYYQYQNI